MTIITVVKIDKKLLLIVFISIVRGINLVISNEVDDEKSNCILCSLEEEIGPIIAGILMLTKFKHKLDKKTENKKRFKHLIILFFLRLVKSCYERLRTIVLPGNDYKYNNLLNTTNGVEILLMTLGTFLILKYKYYIHHMISMGLFCALGITNDFILGSYPTVKYDFFFVYIIYIINEVLVFCYLKYMMDKLYYQYMEIILLWGIIGLIVKIIIFTGISIYEYKAKIDGIIDGLNTYFSETNVWIIIFFQLFYFLFYGAMYYTLIILLMYYLRPNLMIVTDELHVYAGLIFYKDQPNKYYTLPPFFFQIFALLFYFEVLELNFCNLNKNTVKNIQSREINDIDSTNTYSSEIELGDEYYLQKSETKKTEENESNENYKVDKDNLLNELKNIGLLKEFEKTKEINKK